MSIYTTTLPRLVMSTRVPISATEGDYGESVEEYADSAVYDYGPEWQDLGTPSRYERRTGLYRRRRGPGGAIITTNQVANEDVDWSDEPPVRTTSELVSLTRWEVQEAKQILA